MDPATATILASVIASSASAGGSVLGGMSAKRAAQRKAKEQDRATRAMMLNDSLQRQAELEGERYGSRSRLGKRRAQSLMDTAASMREAFNI